MDFIHGFYVFHLLVESVRILKVRLSKVIEALEIPFNL